MRIGAVARLLGVHPRTLRLYEERGLVLPERVRGQRRYTAADVRWLNCVRSLIHEHGYSIDAIIKLLDFAPCWELKDCPEEVRISCQAATDRRLPCWQIARLTCRLGGKSCNDCPVFLRTEGLREPNQTPKAGE
ncbi:MAG: MerR family transcriptional regulator [Armatimonadetes bacterium]|nr:MerR family transcriptional regulator [Armatimonadota bacterium]